MNGRNISSRELCCVPVPAPVGQQPPPTTAVLKKNLRRSSREQGERGNLHTGYRRNCGQQRFQDGHFEWPKARGSNMGRLDRRSPQVEGYLGLFSHHITRVWSIWQSPRSLQGGTSR